MEAEDRKANKDSFQLTAVPRHAAITMLPDMARELLTTLAVAGSEFELTPAVRLFIFKLREFNTADLGETVNAHLDLILDSED